MFPIRDENPTVRTPVAMYTLVVLNAASWVFLQGLGLVPEALLGSVCTFGLIPGELTGAVQAGQLVELGREAACRVDGVALPSLVTSMFMHGSWFHILGNMWFLWVFGDNIEDAMGRGRFVAFYLLCGLVAAAAQVVTDPGSAVPMVGASGAIGGVMGAYARLYPRAQVHTLLFLGFFITTVALPAVFMLGYWFLIQLLQASVSGAAGGGVAFWAHVGGFVAGVAGVGAFSRPERVASHRQGQPLRSARHRVDWP